MSSPAPSMNSTSPPPTTPSAPPPTNSNAPPPSTSAAPPPSTPSAPPPSTPPAPPPSTSSAPPPSTPSAPTPSANSTSPPPPTPSAPRPSANSTSPPSPTPSAPTPSTPTAPSPTSNSTSPPPPSTISPPSPPSGKTPPSPSAKSPPPPSSKSSSPPSSSSSSISTGTVVGIAVGAVVILALFSIICICCRRKRRRPRPSDEYYGGPPPPQPQPPRKDGPYDDAQYQNWQNNAPPPADHFLKIPPQPTGPPPYASRPPQNSSGFSALPPPPPPVFSSDGTGSNYSGSENPPPMPSPGISLGFSKSTFTFEELAMASDGFSDANLLGQGGFGYVHRGMLPNGKEVAIKQLKIGSGQGEREFHAEIETISRVHHKHLVSLVGYCISGNERLLVYEFVPNQTLEFHLHGKDRPTLDWATRMKIALGSAKGLSYLHEDCHPKIIHRDIKAANILLDFKFEAKVADFGLAKFTSDNSTHVSTRVMGTFGYMAPEYASSGKLTERSDVFSFGVMLLELITGKRPVDTTQTYMDDSLVDWARPLLTRALEEGRHDILVDPRLGRNYNPNEMTRVIACAASCVRHSARRRPRMSQIVRTLEGDVSLEDLNEGIKPGHSTVYSSHGSTDYDSSQYNEDMKKFRKMALASKDYASSEYSAPTSEYGQIPSASSSEGHPTREMETGKMKKDIKDQL